MENVIEGNKIIAEFLGWKYLKDTEHPHVFPNGAWNDGDKIGHKDLLFHTSWDWLMPVVEKIEIFYDEESDKYPLEFWQENTTVIDLKITTPINVVWDHAMKFINWLQQY